MKLILAVGFLLTAASQLGFSQDGGLYEIRGAVVTYTMRKTALQNYCRLFVKPVRAQQGRPADIPSPAHGASSSDSPPPVMHVCFTYVCAFYITAVLGYRCLYENDVCDVRGSTPWTCQIADRCPHIAEDLERGIRPRICGFNGSEPIVCCNMRPSRGWCLHYVKRNCPEFQTVVFGGEKSLSKEFPHMALIGYGSQQDISWQCGGSLISDQYVLTAAHCVNPGDQIGPARWVRLGDLDISTDTDDAKPEDFRIDQTVSHPKYDSVSLYNDIALFKLDRKVTFNDYIKPACLNEEQNISREDATVTGWGRLAFVGPTSKHLMKATVSLFSHEDCRRFTGNNLQLTNGIDASSQLCAGEVDGARDTCQGDSGGPLTVNGPMCLNTQIGVTSFGRQCGLPEAPGVYTRVSHYIPWIESIVWA